MTVMAGYRFPVPAAFSLRVLAERFPGGLVGMVTLGWLSGDARARAVRDYWNSIPRKIRDEIAVEELCQAAGIEPGELLGIVVRTAYDLGLDVSGFIARIMGKRSRTSKGIGRMRTCADVAALRKKLKLAARQFSQVLGVGLRSVQGWDGEECNPRPQQQAVLELVNRYVKRNGVKAFHQRFVGEPPRYGKRGRLPMRPAGGLSRGAIGSG